MNIEILNCEQGSADWFNARCGVPTASRFGEIITPSGKPSASRAPLIAEMAAQRVIGFTDAELAEQDRSVSIWTERGHALEDQARAALEITHDLEVTRPGFVRNNGVIGCSPDGLIGDHSGCEIKCPAPKNHVLYWRGGVVPPKYMAQVHGSMIVSERREWWFVSYCPGLPLFALRVEWSDYTSALRQLLEGVVADIDQTECDLRAELSSTQEAA